MVANAISCLTLHQIPENRLSVSNLSTQRHSLWETVKERFSAPNHSCAQACLDWLYEKGDELTPEERVMVFITLRSLAEPGHQLRFTSEKHHDRIDYFIHYPEDENDRDVCCSLPLSHQGEAKTPLSVLAHSAPLNDTIDHPFPLAEHYNRQFISSRKNSNPLPHIDRLSILGDSLSDSEGRMLHKTHGIFPSADQYYEGRFTNGFVWTDFISSPAFLDKPMVNFAEGGSTSADYRLTHFGIKLLDWLVWFVSSLNKQIAEYLSKPTDLAIFSLGSNDYMTFHKGDVNKVIENQLVNIRKTLSAGVKDIVVFGVPDLSLTPYARHQESTGEPLRLQMLSRQHNQKLAKNVADLQELHPDATICFFDIAKAFTDVFIAAERESYNVQEAYNKKGYIHLFGKHYGMNIDSKYLFNDEVHPTQEVHWILALVANEFIKNNYGQNNHKLLPMKTSP